MISPIISNPRPGGHCYITATPNEFTLLFGYPPPILPEGEIKPGSGAVIQVMMPSELETLAGRYTEHLKKNVVGRDKLSVQSPEQEKVEKEYARYLEMLLKHTARSDRRIGILNLFWLAHFKTLRNLILSSFQHGSQHERLKYRIWPVLSGFFKRVQRHALTTLNAAEKRTIGFNLGHDHNWSLINSLMEDQFALTEKDVRDFNPSVALGPHNVNFQMEGEAFASVMKEIQQRFAEDSSRNDPEFRNLIRRHATGFSSNYNYFGTEEGPEPFLFQESMVSYYLNHDEIADTLKKKDRNVKYLVSRIGGWEGFVEACQRVIQALKRSEYLQFFQEFVPLIPSGLNENEIKEMFLEGRLYKYSLNLPVVNNFKRVVILFADIREFTRTSEMAISERELTERLYEVFDPLVHIVVSLGGTIDKFTGDGMMITFGAVRSVSDVNLRALRCAIAIQEAVERLRKTGRTNFQMGLSINSGRVFVANFMHDYQHKETTVIGRQVNLAGRISSTQSLWPDDSESQETGQNDKSFQRQRESLRNISPSDAGAVFMDRESNFYNVGLATSAQFLHDLKKTVSMESFSIDGNRGYRFFDRYLKSEVMFHYVGDAHFKGFRDSTPVYGISWKRLKNVEQQSKS